MLFSYPERETEIKLEQLKRNIWHGGQLLAFSGVDGSTDYDDALTIRTSFDNPGLEIVFPGKCSVRFPAHLHDSILITGDCFELNTSQGKVSGAFLDTHHFLIEGVCDVFDEDEFISYCINGSRTLIGATSHFDATKISEDLANVMRMRYRWLETQEILDQQSGVATRTVFKCLSVMKTQIYSAQGYIRHRWSTPDRWPHRDMWLWDSVFHAIGWRHIDSNLARDLVSAVIDTQRDDGFIAHSINPHKVSDITQPPILSFGAKLINDVSPDLKWIRSIYQNLCKYIEWDLSNRDSDGGGLFEWFIENNPTCRSGESGMDNSPRFDSATQLDAVDFNSFLALECEILSEFAALLGLGGDAIKWQKQHLQLCEQIRTKLWSERHLFFVDYDVDANAPSSVLASSGFLPLICGAASREQAEHLASHLRNPKMFGTPFPIPSIAASDSEHYSKDMWRGPTWININWLVAYGFDRYGMSDIAANLRQQSINEIEFACEKYGVPFEYYDDRKEIDPPALLRKGKCAPAVSPYHQVIHDYGWTATLYIDMICSLEKNNYGVRK